MIKFNVTINLTWLKIIGSLVVLVGLWGFGYSLIHKAFVLESAGVITTGLGTLTYRKHLISKNLNNDVQKTTD